MEPDKAAEGRSGLVWRNGRLLINGLTMQVKLFTIPLFGSEEAVEEMNKFPFFRICNAEAVNISICHAEKQRYAAAVIRQPYSPTVGL